MSNVTAKVVADVEPALKHAFDERVKQDDVTKRAAIEHAMRLYIARPRGKGKQ